jgi:hypothetical protein
MISELKVYNKFGELNLHVRLSLGNAADLLILDGTPEMRAAISMLRGADFDRTIAKSNEVVRFEAEWGSADYLAVLSRYLVENYGWSTKMVETVSVSTCVPDCSGVVLNCENSPPVFHGSGEAISFGNVRVILFGNTEPSLHGIGGTIFHQNAETIPYRNVQTITVKNEEVVLYGTGASVPYGNTEAIPFGNAEGILYGKAGAMPGGGASTTVGTRAFSADVFWFAKASEDGPEFVTKLKCAYAI